jgi:choline dehydrogenase-like flavoprotein
VRPDQGAAGQGHQARPHPGLLRPDLHSGHVADFGQVKVDKIPRMMSLSYPLRPTSQGSVHIRGSLPSHEAEVIANFLSTGHDRKLVVLGAREGHEIMAQEPTKPLVGKETLPGDGYATDEQLLETPSTVGVPGTTVSAPVRWDQTAMTLSTLACGSWG